MNTSPHPETQTKTSFLKEGWSLALHYDFPLQVAFTFVTIGVFFFPLVFRGELHYLFLPWNLFLAWVPYGLSLWMAALWDRGYHKVTYVLFVPWLVFFPNAPYILTDLMHLRYIASPVWYDTLLVFFFGLHGLGLGLSSLQMIHEKLLLPWPKVIRTLALCIIAWASGFAIYLGRFLRWNSWDFIQQPTALLVDIADRFLHPITHMKAHVTTLLCMLILLYAYGLFIRGRFDSPSQDNPSL